MSRFEKFATEQDVMERIEQLRTEGFEESDITVISSQKLEDAYLKYRSVNFKNSEGTTWDKFISMFSDDDPKDKVLGAFDITDSEKEHFKHALDRREILLLKENRAVDEKRDVQNEPREYHETQQQDTQAMETEAAQNERLDARNTATGAAGGYSYDHGSDAESDRLHTADEDDRFDSLHSSKASAKAAGGSRPGGPTYAEQADRAIRDDITLDSERDDVEADNDITLKDTENADEYDYTASKNDKDKDTAGNGPAVSEYDYESEKEEYGYKS